MGAGRAGGRARDAAREDAQRGPGESAAAASPHLPGSPAFLLRSGALETAERVFASGLWSEGSSSSSRFLRFFFLFSPVIRRKISASVGLAVAPMQLGLRLRQT